MSGSDQGTEESVAPHRSLVAEAPSERPVLPPPPEDLEEATEDKPAKRRRAASKGDAEADAPAPRKQPAQVRRARLRLVHIEPWSVMKTAFLLSIAVSIVIIVAVAIVWSVLGAAGLWDSINTMVRDTLGDNSSTFDIREYLGTSRVLGFTMIVAVADIVLITAIATLGAFLYNLAASLLGGVEVTFAEDR